MATETSTSEHGAIYRADGVTQLTKTAAASLIADPAVTDPPKVVAEDIYEDRVPDGTKYPAHERILKFRAGQTILQSQWDACWPAATIAGVSPASGAAAGGTVITITGTDFTPGSTVTVGGNAATGVTVASPTKITATTAAHVAGATDVVVTTDAGAVTAAGAFTFV